MLGHLLPMDTESIGEFDVEFFITLDGFNYAGKKHKAPHQLGRLSPTHTLSSMTVQGLLIRGSVPWTDFLAMLPEEFRQLNCYFHFTAFLRQSKAIVCLFSPVF